MNGPGLACSARVQTDLTKKGAMIRTLILSAGLVLTGLAAAPVHADTRQAVTVQEDIVPMRVAYSAVRRAYPGAEILDGRLVRSAQPYYVIRILTRDGRRRDVRVDARSGRVIG